MSNKKLSKVLNQVKHFADIDADKYREFYTSPEKDFTRERKLGVGAVVELGLLNAGTCLNEQIRITKGIGERPTASAYIQQRGKLPPRFFRRLFEDNLPDYGNLTLLNEKYAVVAVDGSSICIHPNPYDSRTLLKQSKNPNGKACNQIHLNAMTLVLDGYFIDYEIQDLRDENECSACLAMMERLSQSPLQNIAIVTADRGYESYNLMMHAQDYGLKYCFRLKDIGSKGISSRSKDKCDAEGCFDIIVTRRYTRCVRVLRPDFHEDGVGYVYLSQSTKNDFVPPSVNPVGRNHKKHPTVDYYEFSFRLVRFPLGNGSFEVVATNLDRSEFSPDMLKELYFLRWGIETTFRKLKYDDCSSFSHTKSKDVAIGEIVLSLLFHNICTAVIHAVSILLEKKRGRPKRLVYKVSYSDAADTLRLFISGRDPTVSCKK